MTDKNSLLSKIELYGDSDFSRFHTPGHNGELEAFAKYDLTEIDSLPFLYSSDSEIREAEAEFSDILNIGDIYFSAHGATLAIEAMLMHTVSFGGKMVAGRNIHRSVINAAALLDIDIEFFYPEFENKNFRYNPDSAEEALKKSGAKTLYLTSPDYYGNICDIKAFAAVAEKYGAHVIVDNAHGSHLFWQNNHPLQKGAYACVDSFHKTLPALTGAAALLFATKQDAQAVKSAFALFGSTSPNFMILRSILQLKEFLKSDFSGFLKKSAELRDSIEQLGFSLSSDDKTRITLNFAKCEKCALIDYFNKKMITPELLEEERAVFILKPSHNDRDFERLYLVAKDFPFSKEVSSVGFPFQLAKKNCSIREAVMAKSETIDINNARGRTAAEIIAPCPPGIPIVIPGENICEKSVKFLKKCGILKLKVIK